MIQCNKIVIEKLKTKYLLLLNNAESAKDNTLYMYSNHNLNSKLFRIALSSYNKELRRAKKCRLMKLAF